MSLIAEGSQQVEAVLTYWFGTLEGHDDIDRSKSALWWAGGDAVDADVRARFGDHVERALAGGLTDWAATPRGSLARVIVLDQFTRNIGRGTPAAFAGDADALRTCLAATEAGHDRQLRLVERWFLYMPMMHAEDRDMARRSVATFEALSREIAEAENAEALGDPLSHARTHADIVLRFGRYPHRNAILGRENTPDEDAFLAAGGPSFGQSRPSKQG